MPAIEVSHLTKEYRLGAMQSMRKGLQQFGSRLLGRPLEVEPPFRALDDVSFSVEPGEVVGIIGHNGAGKSTLLKILSRITTPTNGSVKVHGRIAPLIEVGAGFVGDFTGRENVYLNGAILGMPRKEIDRKFDEIVEFSEMAAFIDTPVKRYSSGMQVKLAFAVATSIESEILIVDEVLAVGDLAFQRKCFDRMEELIKRQQRTVLLVTHNIRQVERLCSRAVMLENGRIAAMGAAKSVCDLFFEKSQAKITKRYADSGGPLIQPGSTESIRRLAVTLTDQSGNEISALETGDGVTVNLHFESTRSLRRPIFAVGIHTPDMLYLAVDRSEEIVPKVDLPKGQHQVRCFLSDLPLLPGVYAVRASIVSGDIPMEDFYGENLCFFNISPKPNFASGDMRGEGFVSLKTKWSLCAHTVEPHAVAVPS